MVPKVNSGANVYGVLQYNRIKVEAGEGRILYMQGIPERSDGRFSIEECAEAFGYYTALNPRVRKPVVHFSLNPSPEDRLSGSTTHATCRRVHGTYGIRPPALCRLSARRHRTATHARRLGEGGRAGPEDRPQQRTAARHGGLQGVGTRVRPACARRRQRANRTGRIAPGRLPSERSEASAAQRRDDAQAAVRIPVPRGVQYAARTLRPRSRRDPRRRTRQTVSGLVYHVLDDDGQRTGAAVKASRLGDFFGWKALEEKFDASKQRLRQHPERLDRTRREIDHARAEAATARNSRPNFGKTVSTQFPGRTMPGGFTESPSSTARHIRCSTAPGSERSMRLTLSRRGSTVGSKSRPHPCRKSYGRCRPRTAPAGTIFGRRVRGVH